MRRPGRAAARGIVAVLASAAAVAGAAWRLDPGLRPVRHDLSVEDQAGVLSALMDYHRVYEDLYATGGDPALIDAFPATREMRHQVFRDIGFVRDLGLVFVQDLATATLVRTSRTGRAAAEAVTYEEWNYVFQRQEDRVPTSDVKGMGQGFRYRLRHDGTRWVVSGWDPEDVPKPPDDGRPKW